MGWRGTGDLGFDLSFSILHKYLHLHGVYIPHYNVTMKRCHEEDTIFAART